MTPQDANAIAQLQWVLNYLQAVETGSAPKMAPTDTQRAAIAYLMERLA